jgi:Putative metal-binding motif
MMAACTSPFSSCEAYRNCANVSAGSNGQAGEGGAPPGDADAATPQEGGAAGAWAGAAGQSAAGAGGEAPAVECVRDSDCSDGLACNGEETCDQGSCTPGVSPCANPDSEHCDAVCVELKGAASCSVRGQDQDGDGHFASTCVTSPGDDCDDSDATIYAGAPELCDGLDNDCDGKIDWMDGLGAGGTTVAIGPSGATRSLPRIAWATDKSVYGIAYRDVSSSTAADLYFEAVAPNGEVTLAPTLLNSAATASSGSLSLIWGNDTFGAAWSTPTAMYFRAIGGDGSFGALSSAIALPYASSLARSAVVVRGSDGQWYVLYENSDFIYGNTVSPLGSIGAPVTLEAPYNTYLAAAAFGTKILVSTVQSIPVAGAAPIDDINAYAAGLTGPTLWGNGFNVKFGPGPDGIAIVSIPTGGSTYQVTIVNTKNVHRCGPVELPANFVAADVVATPTGYLVISSGAVQAQVVNADCTLGLAFSIDSGPATDVHVAGSEAGYGIVWQDTASASPKRRLLGPRFCD